MGILATGLFNEAALRFVLLGTATGALTALVALGIVIVYRASGVLNFSTGAMGGIAAYYCYDLRDEMATPPAVALGLVAGVLLGLLTYGVLALLRDASQLARLIATLGLFGAGQAFMVLRWGPSIVQPRPMLPSRNVTLFGDVRIGQDRGPAARRPQQRAGRGVARRPRRRGQAVRLALVAGCRPGQHIHKALGVADRVLVTDHLRRRIGLLPGGPASPSSARTSRRPGSTRTTQTTRTSTSTPSWPGRT